MFTPDGKLLLGSDKSTIMHKIDDMIKPDEEEYTEPIKFEKVSVFDGMAIFNKVKIGPAVNDCQEFADAFLKIILEDSLDAFEIHNVFARYITDSLKANT